MNAPSRRILIVGGVGGGASAAARLRRLDESAEIIVFDRGPYVSFANCGLPYHVGDVIPDEQKLLVATPALFHERFAIAVHTEHEAVAIDRERKRLRVRDLASGTVRDEPYDVLLLSPGAQPIRPPIPGLELDGIYSLRTIPDARRIRTFLTEHDARRAVVVGGGFIGLEMAENLRHRGLHVTIIERADQVMPPLDAELAWLVQERLVAQGVDVRTGDAVARFTAQDSQLRVHTASGAIVDTDIVILAIGVRPETTLARDAGLTIGASGGIEVDAQMRTADPAIFAVGDAVETVDVVTGRRQVVPLAGVASRQGRIAADVICGRPSRFRGVQGTAVCGAFGLTIATTGASERSLREAGIDDFDAIYLHPGHHVGYYPGAEPIHLKVLVRRADGLLLGAQAVGGEGTEKRIDVLATALQLGATVHDLAEVELCYAPQFGAAKDPVNLAGFIAQNLRSGDVVAADWAALGDHLVLDVREAHERSGSQLPGAVHIPLHQLRARYAELPTDRPVAVMCAVGQRAYYAVRLLRQLGVDARHLPGGWATGRSLYASRDIATADA